MQKNNSKTPKKNKGFSLIEVLVSLVLISSTGLAFYSLLNNQFSQLRRINSHQQALQQQRQLLIWSQKPIPPSIENSPYRIANSAQSIQLETQTQSPLTPTVTPLNTRGSFTLQLNTVILQLEHENNKTENTTEIKRLMLHYK